MGIIAPAEFQCQGALLSVPTYLASAVQFICDFLPLECSIENYALKMTAMFRKDRVQRGKFTMCSIVELLEIG